MRCRPSQLTCRTMLLLTFLLGWMIGQVWLWPALATEAVPGAETILGLTFGQLMALVSNFGLGGMVFIVWLIGLRRQTSMESLLTTYSAVQREHLEAFREINAAYRITNEKTVEAILLNVSTLSTLAEKVERMERDRERERKG